MAIIVSVVTITVAEDAPPPSGCINRPDENNGHCVVTTLPKSKTYTCADSGTFQSNDCVKGM